MPTIRPGEELDDQDESAREGHHGQAVDGAAVGVAAQQAIVSELGVGCTAPLPPGSRSRLYCSEAAPWTQAPASVKGHEELTTGGYADP